MNEFKPFDDRLAGLIAALSPVSRRRMAADIAKKLRTSQQRRIKMQKAPDGTPYAARKRQPARAKKGRVKREMFVKLRTNRFMKATGRDDAAVVEFAGKVQRMAKVHQFGLKDRPNPHSEDIQYPKRQLLGINRKNELLIEGLIAEYLVQV
ncbi:phage virion morphogenesis protein [Enterobacter hormaechei]|uniref:phage virion morphogenesis protein n=1 Tax=Enterobacter hormaechei TaxID=158836 RepID=UPI0003BEC4B2|nr:phage virion morphogenesis protein [Enterobacter hormaechei]DAI70849.1 MAG TPA: virion morphogenesis protein [Caudoviricetes sp.]HDT4285078.1 phage virion morphogenesis protein [Enterobacter hormaechei subsp. xiangfangensis]ESM48744.1 phage virion morphogenesis protein [Enterobacter hormaechei]MCD0241562.1 phage virion morphogenesis protein [Enterobacter hormaechei]MCM7030575.1 phage virion morphogenesis protein [Enterobacter hormaechei]